MKREILRLLFGRPWPWAADLWGVLGRGGGLSIRKGGGAWGAGEPSDEPSGTSRYRAPSLGPAWSIRVIAAAVEAEQGAESEVAEDTAPAADGAPEGDATG
jgi:hypothetical protein